MPRSRASALRLPALALLLAATLTACDSAEVTPPPPPPPPPAASAPAVTVGSVEVSGDRVYFSARPGEDATFQKVVVVPPPPYATQTVNLGNEFVLASESVTVGSTDGSFWFYPYWPDADGAWSFTFTVSTGVGGSARQHTVPVSLNR